MIVVNLKAYKEGIGKDSEKIVDACEAVKDNTGEEIVVCPQNTDLLRFQDSEVSVFAQKADNIDTGSHTGHTPVKVVKDAGADGLLLNHSENRIDEESIEEILERADNFDLTTIVCAQSPEECGKYSSHNPDYVAFEPPELIGGDTSVSEAKPNVIEEAVEASESPVLTGAGIKNSKDVEKSLKHGCEGVLVASGVVKSENPQKAVQSLAEGL